jgi:hypothetical protein
MSSPTTAFWRPFFRTTDPGDPPVGQAWMRYDDETGEILCVDSNGDSVFPAATVTPAGTDTAIQFNNDGVLGGDADAFAWDDANGSFQIFTENVTSQIMFGIGPTQSMSFDMDATQDPPDISFVNLETLGTMEITSDGLLTITSPTTGVLIGIATTSKIAFRGATPETKPTITGSKDSNAALTSLLESLAVMGLLTDGTS